MISSAEITSGITTRFSNLTEGFPFRQKTDEKLRQNSCWEIEVASLLEQIAMRNKLTKEKRLPYVINFFINNEYRTAKLVFFRLPFENDKCGEICELPELILELGDHDLICFAKKSDQLLAKQWIAELNA